MSENNDYSGCVATFVVCLLLGTPVFLNFGFGRGLFLILIVAAVMYFAFVRDA